MGSENWPVKIFTEILFAFVCLVRAVSLLLPPRYSSLSPGSEDKTAGVPWAVGHALKAVAAGPLGLQHLSFQKQRHTGQVTAAVRFLVIL